MAKRIPYKITDIAALQEAYPEVVTDKHVVEKVVDKEKLYQIIKVQHSIGRKVEGVSIMGEKPDQADIEGALDNAGQQSGEPEESPLED